MGKKEDRVLLGYTGSFASGWKWSAERDRLKEEIKNSTDPKKRKKLEKRLKEHRKNKPGCSPVYVSKEKYKKLKEFTDPEYYSCWL